MQKEIRTNELEFEILKLVFFVVTYLLITDGLSYEGFKFLQTNLCDVSLKNSISAFYNTLFIFEVSTWIDYLSELAIVSKGKRFYDGSYRPDSLIPLLGSIIGIFTVFISIYCVCKKDIGLINVAVLAYYISLLFIGFRAHKITMIVLTTIKKSYR